MTRSEREQLIRAHLEGTMSSGDEHDFFINVALDTELRTELKAHRTIESALRKDREIDPGEIVALQQSVMASLAAAPGRNANPTEAPEATSKTPDVATEQPAGSTHRRRSRLLLALLFIGALVTIRLIPFGDRHGANNGVSIPSGGMEPTPRMQGTRISPGIMPSTDSETPKRSDGSQPKAPPPPTRNAGTEKTIDSSRSRNRIASQAPDSARRTHDLRNDTPNPVKPSDRKNDSLGIGVDLRIGNGQ